MRTGSVLDDRDSMGSTEATVATPETIQRVKEVFTERPTTSLRQASRDLKVSHSTVHRILKKELNLFPYKIQCQQPLGEIDVTRRYEFANEMITRIEANRIDPKHIWFSDESHFWLDGYVNRQNYRHWGSEQPHLAVVRPLHPERITVWCAICYDGIIGPFFIRENITAEVYRRDIYERFVAIARERKMVANYWFQQDGAAPHRTEENLVRIMADFDGRIIALNAPKFTISDLEWPPSSPDMTVCDFFLWGYTKDKVYKDRPANLQELQRRITTVIESIPEEIRHNAINTFVTRLRHLLTIGGGYFENLVH